MKNLSKLLAAMFLILLAVLFRTTWHLGPNIEFVTTASFLAAAYLGGFWAAAVPFLAMVVSDKIISNTNIYLFTWSAFVFIGLWNYLVMEKLGKNKLILKQTGLGVIAALFFYLYTNFGVWATDMFGMYSRDFHGLVKCYLMGLPFLRFNLLGNLIFIPASFALVEFLCAIIRLWWKVVFLLMGRIFMPANMNSSDQRDI